LPFRNTRDHLLDIQQSIALIGEFVGTMSFDDYLRDVKTRSAVERQLQILTEAAIRLGEEAPKLCPNIDWAGFRAMGNILRHVYHRVDDQIVWDTIQHELPAMATAIGVALRDSANAQPDTSI